MHRSPVFIVGSPRSGTSILVRALASLGYQGYNEGNFLPLMNVIDRIVDNHFAMFGRPNPRVLAAQVDPMVLKRRIEDIFKDLTDNLNPAALWFDKSGNAEMIRAIPTLRRLWPDSVYIFAKRRAIENVVSRVKKFPGHNFEYHCADWAKTMAAWREARVDLPIGTYLEVDQQDLLRNTQAVSARILNFLELGSEYLDTLVNVFKSKRPQETAEGSASRTYALENLGWSESQLAIFNKYCDAEMKAYGYGSGPEYQLK